jgi:phosphate transport system substrate-binding protein
MSRRQVLRVLAARALAGAFAPAPGVFGADAGSAALVFAGSGSNLAAARVLVEAFGRLRPDVRIEIPKSIGSTGAVQAAAGGGIALGMISQPLGEWEQGLGLTVMPYARTAIVVGAHPIVADDGVTTEELVQIQLGKKSRWRDGREIIVLTRQPGDSTISVLEQAIPGFSEAYAESQRRGAGSRCLPTRT